MYLLSTFKIFDFRKLYKFRYSNIRLSKIKKNYNAIYYTQRKKLIIMETNDFENVTKAKPRVKGVFKNRDFARLWIGHYISYLGSNLTFIVLPLFI